MLAAKPRRRRPHQTAGRCSGRPARKAGVVSRQLIAAASQRPRLALLLGRTAQRRERRPPLVHRSMLSLQKRKAEDEAPADKASRLLVWL